MPRFICIEPDISDNRGERPLDLALRGAFAHRISYLSFEGTYKNKDVLYEIIDGSMVMRMQSGKIRKFKLDIEYYLARKVSVDHLTFLRYLKACISLCKLADLSFISFAGVPALQLISDLRRPEFNKVLSKRGLIIPPPRQVNLNCIPPQKPTSIL